MKKLSQLLAGVEYVRRSGPDVEVAGVEYDSRRATSGSLFVAMQGGAADGNRYAAAAIRQGASSIATDSANTFDELSARFPETGFIEVRHGRRALALLGANFFDHPEEKLALTGVTGTNGKTTTTFLLDAMLRSAGRKTILLGTIEYHLADEVRASPHTTPESRDLLELFREGLSLGASETVMEVSSHALTQGRVWGLAYDVAVFTNLTRDHLDFHGDMESYFAAKRSLFDGVAGPPPRVAVVNLDDEYGERIARAAGAAGSEVFGYGMHGGDFHAEGVEMLPTGMRFRMATPKGELPIATKLTGRVNVYNLLAATAAGMARGLTPSQLTAGAKVLDHVPGRFQTVDAGQPFTVVVDYAHTEDALKNLVTLGREFVAAGGGRVITLFGCGGDRDRTKRPAMGRVAGEGSDLVVLTSDNPRSEDPAAILREVLPGLESTTTKYVVESDRAIAIGSAIRAACAGDIVLIAGKGHEKVQALNGRTIRFDDAEVARVSIATLGYALPARETK